jgi:uncharacterized BrkB/YihY/UPF0761 family membrane protein
VGGAGVTLALGRAFAEILDVPRVEQPSGLRRRGRGLSLLAVLAVLLVVSTAATGVAAADRVGATAERGAAVIASLVGNVLIYLTIFGLLMPRPRRVRDLLSGVAVAAVGSLVLQSVGGWYVDRAISGASATYGTFALVIGPLSWFLLLLANLVLIAAEVNAFGCGACGRAR